MLFGLAFVVYVGFSPCLAFNIEERLDQLERKYQSEIAELKTEVERIKTQNIALMYENKETKRDSEELANEYETFKQRLMKLEAKCFEEAEETESESDDPGLRESGISEPIPFQSRPEIQDLKKYKRQTASGTVAFHAVLSKDTCFNQPEIIKFDDIKLNIGGGAYSPDYGFYMVPVDGTYVFTWTVTSTTHHYVTVEFVVNGQVHGLTISDSDSSSEYHPASGTVVMELTSGQQVSMRMSRTNGCMVMSDQTGTVLTTISGWRLG